MEAVREKWTDERLDDPSGKIEDLGRTMNQRFDSMERRFEAIDRRLDRLLLGLSTTFIAGFVALGSMIIGQG